MVKMTLEEKVGQMHQIAGNDAVTGPLNPSSNDGEDLRKGLVGSMLNVVGADKTYKYQKIAVEESRLGIPLIFGHDVIHGCKTIFPIPLAESCSWDLDIIERSAQIAAYEASAMGLHWTFAPMVDIARDPRWGRISEGAGEDTYLAAKIAEARVKGFQGDDLGSLNTVAACAKHFAAYGASEAGRDYNQVDISENSLRNIYLPPFKAALDAGVASFMNAFNVLNGIPSTINELLVKSILKAEWKFAGIVVSDYNSIGELVQHGVAKDKMESAELAANALCDMDMAGYCYRDHLVELVREGKVAESIIETAVEKILILKYRLGLFDDPYRFSKPNREKELLLNKGHRDSARDCARKSIVLLKNNCVLPLTRNSGIKKIALIGPLAESKFDMLGSWYCAGDENDVVSFYEGMKNRFGKDYEINYSKGCEIDSPDEEDFSEANNLGEQSEIIFAYVGEAGLMSGEASCRTDISLPGNQLSLLKELKKTGKPLVVVLSNGRPLEINWISENVDAILETWFLGVEAGNALADIISGDFNPSGKLTVTFPRNVGQIPIYYNHLNTGRPLHENPTEHYRSRYLDSSIESLFPFGFGLSYTKFEYSNFSLSKNKIAFSDELIAEVDVKNIGDIAGEEIVQLYIHDKVATISRPVKELKAFKKIYLASGETKKVEFNLSAEDFKYYDKNKEWNIEPGTIEIFVGPNSVELLMQKVEITN